MKSNNEFLDSLDSGVSVSFESWEQYSDMILDIFEAITADKLEYVVQIENDGNFSNLTIVDIID